MVLYGNTVSDRARKKADEEKKRLEAEKKQSQKQG